MFRKINDVLFRRIVLAVLIFAGLALVIAAGGLRRQPYG
jgi:hypothetical protein